MCCYKSFSVEQVTQFAFERGGVSHAESQDQDVADNSEHFFIDCKLLDILWATTITSLFHLSGFSNTNSRIKRPHNIVTGYKDNKDGYSSINVIFTITDFSF